MSKAYTKDFEERLEKLQRKSAKAFRDLRPGDEVAPGIKVKDKAQCIGRGGAYQSWGGGGGGGNFQAQQRSAKDELEDMK